LDNGVIDVAHFRVEVVVDGLVPTDIACACFEIQMSNIKRMKMDVSFYYDYDDGCDGDDESDKKKVVTKR
jgi:hypothetical protein